MNKKEQNVEMQETDPCYENNNFVSIVRTDTGMTPALRWERVGQTSGDGLFNLAPREIKIPCPCKTP